MLTAQAPKRFNPMVELLAAKKPVFGLYAPSNRRFGAADRAPPAARRGRPRPARPAAPKRTPSSRRKLSPITNGDFIFDGSMEGDFDAGCPFTEFVKGMAPPAPCQVALRRALTTLSS